MRLRIIEKYLILLYFISFHRLEATCFAPASIDDFVTCQNAVFDSHPSPQLSDFLDALAAEAELACTRSRASAQPAALDLGDLRCFFVFPSKTTVSFNLVEGVNENHIELSQLAKAQSKIGVVLGMFRMSERATLAQSLAAATTTLPGTRMTCASCHHILLPSMVDIEGGKAWLMKPVKLNSTLRGTIPLNGQISPTGLPRELEALEEKHRCLSSRSETCRRFAIVRKMGRLAAIDNP